MSNGNFCGSECISALRYISRQNVRKGGTFSVTISWCEIWVAVTQQFKEETQNTNSEEDRVIKKLSLERTLSAEWDDKYTNPSKKWISPLSNFMLPPTLCSKNQKVFQRGASPRYCHFPSETILVVIKYQKLAKSVEGNWGFWIIFDFKIVRLGFRGYQSWFIQMALWN